MDSHSLPGQVPPSCPLHFFELESFLSLIQPLVRPASGGTRFHDLARGRSALDRPGVWALICRLVLGSGEGREVLHGRTIVKMGLTRMLPLEGEESCLSLPVPVPTVSLAHPHPVPGTRRFVSCKVQPGNTAKTRSTGHLFLIFPSPPLSSFPFSCSFPPPCLAATQIFEHLRCARCWGYHEQGRCSLCPLECGKS